MLRQADTVELDFRETPGSSVMLSFIAVAATPATRNELKITPVLPSGFVHSSPAQVELSLIPPCSFDLGGRGINWWSGNRGI